MATYLSKDGLMYFWSLIKNRLSGKQDTLTSAQLAAANSGITAAKVSTYDGYAASIAAKASDSAVVHIADKENITGEKTFNAGIHVLTVPSIDNTAVLSQDMVPSIKWVKDYGAANHASLTHAHGNIANDGTVSNEAITVTASTAAGDYLVISDTSDSGKLGKAVQFTGASGKYLTASGTWATPPNTDTKNTAGTTETAGTANMLLVGAGSQAASAQTFTKTGCYIGTDGFLYSGSKKVLTDHQSLSGYYTKAEVDSKLTSAMTYKGSVATYADLPTAGNKTGDFYNVTATGANYAWDGSGWDETGQVIDLTAITNAEIDAIVAA